MAIDNNSKLVAASKLQSNNFPVRGCGAVWVQDGESLPAGDYIGCHSTTASISELTNIVFRGAPIEDPVGAAVTAITLDHSRGGTTFWAMNIESCDVANGNMMFYKRCK